MHVLKETKGKTSPQYLDLLSEVKVLRKKINELKYSDKLSSASNVLFPFKKMPDMVVEYFRLFREVKIQTKIMEYTLPMYEQAKVEEQKSIPTLQIVDKAVPAQLKYRPKKAFIILGAFFITAFISIYLIFFFERIQQIEEAKNSFEKKLKSIVDKIIGLYKLHLQA